MQSLVVIPARGGSKRLPGKNLMQLDGRSLMQWTAEALASSALAASPCLLSTDDPAIAEEGRRLGWQVPWLRPAHLATDTASSLDTVLHALDWWRDSEAQDPDVVVLMQVTSPFRDPRHLDAALAMMSADPALDGVISAADLHRTPASVFVHSAGRLRPLGPAASGSLLTPNGSFYVVRTRALRTERTFFPRRLAAVSMDARQSLDIDTADDFAMAEALAALPRGAIAP